MPKAAKGWNAYRPPIGDDMHVLPTDEVAHTYANCICSPVAEHVTRDDGSTGWRVTHQAIR